MKNYVCQLQFFPCNHAEICGTCYHAYPHKHKKNCNGDHCKQSNVYNKSMRDELTCQPITDLKEDPVVISNVKYLKKMEGQK